MREDIRIELIPKSVYKGLKMTGVMDKVSDLSPNAGAFIDYITPHLTGQDIDAIYTLNVIVSPYLQRYLDRPAPVMLDIFKSSNNEKIDKNAVLLNSKNIILSEEILIERMVIPNYPTVACPNRDAELLLIILPDEFAVGYIGVGDENIRTILKSLKIYMIETLKEKYFRSNLHILQNI